MKINKLFTALMLFSALAVGFVACDSEIPDVPENINPTEPTEETGPSVNIDSVMAHLEGKEYLTVAQAVALCKENGETGIAGDFLIIGYVRNVQTTTDADLASYGNITFDMADENYGRYNTKFTAYRSMGYNGDKFTSMKQVQLHDFVVLHVSKMYMYGGTPENAGNNTAYLFDSTNELAKGQGGEDPGDCEPVDISGITIPEGTLTVAEAVAQVEGTSDVEIAGSFNIKGYVKAITQAFNSQYGNISFTIGDDACSGGQTFTCYRALGLNGDKFTAENQVAVGDFVIVNAAGLTNYKGNTPENSGKIYIVASTNENIGGSVTPPADDCTPVDISGIEIPEGTLTVAEAIAKVAGTSDQKVNGPFYVKGYVKAITQEFSSQYGNISFSIGDDACKAGETFLCYHAYGLGGNKFTSADQVEVGDFVVMYAAALTNYKGNTPENSGNCYIYATTNDGSGSGDDDKKDDDNKGEAPEGDITPSQAQAIGAALASGATTSYEVTIVGWISSIKTAYSSQYKNITFYLADEEGGKDVFQCFRVKGGEDLQVGMKVSVTGKITNYQGNTPETSAGATYEILEN